MTAMTKSPPPTTASSLASEPRPEPKILFQKYFKSVGPRTYAAQLKEAANGNHFLVLTEGKRDEKSDQVRKTRLFVFSGDFKEFFAMIEQTAAFVRQHPVPEGIARRQARFWSKNEKPGTAGKK